jgi:hypothetical protein
VPLELYVYWHTNVDEDAAGQWFRKQVIRMLARSSG